MYVVTESGYLMLVKSFTDDLAWQVQRQLVNTYFRKSEESSAVKDETAPAAQKPILKSEPKKQISPIDVLKAALGAYTTQDEDTPAFTRIHIYDSTNRKIGLVKITKPDMKMTFKVPGDPTLHELSESEDIRKYL